MVLEKRRRVKHGGRVEQADWTGLAGTGGQWVQAGAFLCHCVSSTLQCALCSACKCTGLVLPTILSSATGSALLYYCVCQWVQLFLSLVASGYKQVLFSALPLCLFCSALPASAQCELYSACKFTGLVLPTLFSSATGSALLYYCVCQWVQLFLSLVASGSKQVLLLSSPCLCSALTISQVDNKVFSYQAPQLKNLLELLSNFSTK